MKLEFKFLMFFLLFSLLLSCKKDEEKDMDPAVESTIVDTSDSLVSEDYYPLSIGNSWVYFGAAFGEYTISVDKEVEIGGVKWKELLTVYTNGDPSTTAHTRWEGSKMISKSNVPTGEELLLTLLDVTKNKGDSYNAGSVTYKNSGTIHDAKYTSTVIDKHESFTFNNVVYADVFEIQLDGSFSFKIDRGFYAGYGFSKEELDELESIYDDYPVTKSSQVMYFAKNIGLIGQRSVSTPSLNVDVVSYMIQ